MRRFFSSENVSGRCCAQTFFGALGTGLAFTAFALLILAADKKGSEQYDYFCGVGITIGASALCALLAICLSRSPGDEENQPLIRSSSRIF